MKKIDLKVPERGVTANGDKVISIREILSKPKMEDYIKQALLFIFSDIGLDNEVLLSIADKILELAKNSVSLIEFEQRANSFLQVQGVLKRFPQKISGRAEKMAKMLEPFLLRGSILDLGCGPGKVGANLATMGYQVTLADVYQNPVVSNWQLPFVKVPETQELPFDDDTFDNVMILAMLHHTQQPLKTLQETRRILKPNGRLQLIETVFGVYPDGPSASYSSLEKEWAELSVQEQRMATMFFDYFGNHVTWYYTEEPDNYVPVPFNFNTPQNLSRVFHEQGFDQVYTKNIGLDPGSGVYHVMYVLEK